MNMSTFGDTVFFKY